MWLSGWGFQQYLGDVRIIGGSFEVHDVSQWMLEDWQKGLLDWGHNSMTFG